MPRNRSRSLVWLEAPHRHWPTHLFAPKVIIWGDLPAVISEEQRQANLARSAAIRTDLHAYLAR